MAFSFRAGTNWCHDFPKIARESGFHFNVHRTRVRVDWNRISSIDIDRVIGERDFSTIDKNVNNIVDCCLESEYDVKILEPNFVKLFRLAQLAVEYLLYCKQYLDQSVMILKDELRSKIEENVKLKKQVDEMKSNERCRVVEKKFNDSHGEIHKCPRCPKTFVSELFLNAHMDRRHPQSRPSSDCSPVHKRYLAETEKLHNEIKTLKERLNRTERVIRNESEKCVDTDSVASDSANDREKGSNEGRLVEGKKSRYDDDERYKRYRQEIKQFKSMLLGEIKNLKLEETNRWEKEETEENVKELIRRQEKEIERLRDQLQKRLTPDIEGIHAKLENQEDFWQSKIDNLETRHRLDMEKLYSQLKVSRESVNEMRLDYMSKINDLECRSRSESAIIPDKSFQTEKSPSETPVTIKNSKDYIYVVREKRQRQEDEQIKNDSITNAENISNLTDKVSHNNIIKKSLSLPPKIPRVNESLVKSTLTLIPTDKDRNRRKNRLEESRSCTVESLLRESRLSKINKQDIRAIDKQDIQSSLDSGDCTTTTTEDAVQPIRTTSRMSKSAEKCNGKVVEKLSISSSEESLDDSEESVESQTEDTDESHEKKINGNERGNEISIEQRLDSKLRDLGIDPEWQAIPNATFLQMMENIGHVRKLNAKKYHKFDEIRHKIIQQIAQALSQEVKVRSIDYLPMRSPLEKLVTNVKMKASRALKILEKNEGSRRINLPRAERAASSKIKKLPRPEHRITEMTQEVPNRRPVSRNPSVNNISVESINDFKHSYESIKDFVRDTNRKIVTSTPQRNDGSMVNHSDSMPSLYGSPMNNGKGVLKLTSVSSGSQVKKKVLFDLEGQKSPATKREEKYPSETKINERTKNDSRLCVSDISSGTDSHEEGHRDIEESPQSGSILLKTRQSEKIALISRQIEKQLSIPREKPVGAVEAMFMDKFSLKRDNEDESRVPNACRSFKSPPTRQFENKTSTDNNFPQAAPRTSQYRNIESKDSNLDMDIDELLEIQ